MVNRFSSKTGTARAANQSSRLDNSGGFVDVHRKTIIHCYSKAKYFENYSSDFFAQICQPKAMLSDLNTSTIEYLASQLNISTQIRRASDIGGVGNKADLLADICKIVGATQYISVPGSKDIWIVRLHLRSSASLFDISISIILYTNNCMANSCPICPLWTCCLTAAVRAMT